MNTILFLASNPNDTQPLQLYKEIFEVQSQLDASPYSDQFRLVSQVDVERKELISLFDEYRPSIVHFSGHGNNEGEIYLRNDDGDRVSLSKEAISNLFQQNSGQIQCVILNACYAEEQASAISDVADCVVIGWKETVEDDSAIDFAREFYRQIAKGSSVNIAYQQAKILTTDGETNARMLATTVNANKIVFVDNSLSEVSDNSREIESNQEEENSEKPHSQNLNKISSDSKPKTIQVSFERFGIKTGPIAMPLSLLYGLLLGTLLGMIVFAMFLLRTRHSPELASLIFTPAIEEIVQATMVATAPEDAILTLVSTANGNVLKPDGDYELESNTIYHVRVVPPKDRDLTFFAEVYPPELLTITASPAEENVYIVETKVEVPPNGDGGTVIVCIARKGTPKDCDASAQAIEPLKVRVLSKLLDQVSEETQGGGNVSDEFSSQ